MRSWIFGQKDGGDKQAAASQDPPDGNGVGTGSTQRFPGSAGKSPLTGGPGFPRSSSGAASAAAAGGNRRQSSDVGFMSAFAMARGAAAQDAEMERKVSIAARNLGDGVLKIVMAAKESGRAQPPGSGSAGSSQMEWKTNLLDLLGGPDSTSTSQASKKSGKKNNTDIDVLLENSKCDKFVLRCVENELPPNLIHCLRLLRVMELQHANLQRQAHGEGEVQSISQGATSKVQRLLCLLCKDSSVGEQLRPHLFGLLALSGASYPPSGVHVGCAASAVIVAFSEHCLSTSLVWFLHDRKMIVHMTDDIKELCGITEVTSSSSASLCLYGKDAEEAGLWDIALRAVVYLVVCSCNHQCLELLNDFDTAGGYHVLLHAIKNSTSKHAKNLMELVTALACCTTETSPTAPMGDLEEAGKKDKSLHNRDQDKQDAKLITNMAAMDIIEDLMATSMPLLKEYEQVYGGERPNIASEEGLHELATFSLRTALNVRFAGVSSCAGSEDFDLAMELLVTTLQLYSDHHKNYAIVEARHNVLAYYLLAFPTFEDVSLKVLILKTLEYVITGVAGTDAVKPLKVTSEIFFALCKSLLKGANGIEMDSEEEGKIYEELLLDTDMMCATIEKLLEFDDRVSEVMLDGGVLTSKLNEVLELVTQATESGVMQEHTAFEADGKLYIQPPAKTPLDRIFAAICRVLKLVVIQQFASPRSTMPTSPSSSNHIMDDDMGPPESQLHLLLFTAVKDLGDDAAAAALGVFDAMMGAQISSEMLLKDMEFVMEVLDYFAKMTKILSKQSLKKKQRGTSFDNKMNGSPKKQKSSKIKPRTVLREADILAMLGSVLEVNGLAQDSFRACGGFEYIVQMTLCLEGFASMDPEKHAKHNKVKKEKCDNSRANATIKMLESAFNLLGASVGVSRKVGKGRSGGAESSLSSLAIEVLTEDGATQFSGPIAKNRQYLHRRGFYVDFVNAISSTGIFSCPRYALSVMNLSLASMDPSLLLSDNPAEKEDDSEAARARQTQVIRVPDASRYVMGLSTCLPRTEYGVGLSKRALDEMLRLCSPEFSGLTLTQMSYCGLVASITNRHEFSPLLEDRSHHLYSRFVLLLRRIAAFNMSYTDFISLLRGIAGPMLMADNKDAPDHLKNRIRLPVISSSVASNTVYSKMPHDEAWQAREADFCTNLETLCVIAERGDRTARCRMGGDSLERTTLYMQDTKIEDRLYCLAEEGTLRFLEIKSIDSYALTFSGKDTAGTPSPSNAAERIWTPLAVSGFSYSIWLRIDDDEEEAPTGSLFLLDISSPPDDSSSPDGGHQGAEVYISIWFDLHSQRFNIVSSASHRNEPTCFPVSPLRAGVWHHVLLAYLPPKRSMLNRRAVLGMFVDGRPLEAEVRVDSVNLPPNSRVHIGAPNPMLASSGIVRGPLAEWDLGPAIMFSTLVSNRDATAIFAAGPNFQGLFWGDRPQRLSLTATATAAFAMLAESGEQGSVAGALRRRQVPEVEAAGHVVPERGFGGGRVQGPEADSLGAVGLLCTVQPEHVVFGFFASSSSSSMRDGLSPSNRRHFSRRLVNVARMNASNETVSTDAIVYGSGSVISPHSFADNVQWIGGPNVLIPVTNAARSTRSLALSLRMIRASVLRHPPNLEMLQVGGGYRMLGALLRQKKLMDEFVLDQCFAFAVHGFDPILAGEKTSTNGSRSTGPLQLWPSSDSWVFADLDAMKYLLLNHQVWDMRGSSPVLPLRLLSFLNGLVAQLSTHKAFNSRRLHLLGIVHWTLHLMLEAAELYTAGEVASSAQSQASSVDEPSKNMRRSDPKAVPAAATAAYSNGWYVKAPSVESTAVGADPDNTVLLACKTLLRRVLTFMLTPGDLEAIAEAAVYTVSITGPNSSKISGAERHKLMSKGRKVESTEVKEDKLLPGPVARIYLLRLIEELVVDGVNEIVTAGGDNKQTQESDGPSEPTIEPHAGGGASNNQSYFTSMMTRTRKASDGSMVDDFTLHPKHQQAQAFLQAFGGVLTPVWFACLLEGCHEEASASAVLRLMILMLQSSPAFATEFEDAGGFAPLVLSIPKFSTCPSIIMSMLSQLLHAPILHIPCFGVLDSSQLCEIFASESDAPGLILKKENAQSGRQSDPSCGIFALLAECLGRNIQLAPFQNELGRKARQTNEAVLQLLSHHHKVSSPFQQFCRTPDFLEPLAQALCLVHDEKLQRMQNHFDGGTIVSEVFNPHEIRGGGNTKMKRRGTLSDVPRNETPTERFVGRPEEVTGSSGIGMVHLLRLVVSHAIMSGPLAAPLISALFRSFPIHASPEQVEAFHLVMIEHCRSVVEDALLSGEPVAFANCIGLSSVLLDRLMEGFYTSEPTLETVNIILSVLTAVTSRGSNATRVLGNAELNILTADAAHMARLTCLTALQRSRPLSPYDEGDEDLKVAILDLINENVQPLLVIPAGGNQSRKSKLGGGVSQAYPPPANTSRLYPLWLSASLSRSFVQCAYTDLSVMPAPDRAFIVALMDEIYALLFDMREDLRDTAVSIVVALLQQRRAIMSEILITESSRGDRVETIDIMNRGGFGALLVAHEAATIAESVSTVPRRGASGKRVPASKGRYASFFEWLERNQPQVEAVFNGIHMESRRLFPGAESGAATPEEAIENEQKNMLLKLTSQESSDRTILGGLERAELAQRCYGKTADNHDLWMRQGFDDLSSGAMQWKFLLRQLKGSCSIWEGGALFDHESSLYKKALLPKGSPSKRAAEEDANDVKRLAKFEMVKRWKLDLTEGYERQRRRFLPNYEFHGLYNLDEMADHVSDNETNPEVDSDGESLGSGSEAFSSGHTKTKLPPGDAHVPAQRRGAVFGDGQSMEATAALLKDLNLKRGKGQKNLFDFYDDDALDEMDSEDDDEIHTATTDMSSDQEESRIPSEPLTVKEDAGLERLKSGGDAQDDQAGAEAKQEKELASSYDLITGLLQAGDWPEKSYNVNRCTGLEVRKGLLLWCRDAIYIVDGFEQTDGDGLEGYIKRVEKESSTFFINLRPQDFKATEEGEEGHDSNHGDTDDKKGSSGNRNKAKASQGSSEEITYQHRSQRIAFNDLYSVFRRKYQLQGNALEFFDVHRSGTLVAFSSSAEREEVLSQILTTPLPNSIFSTTGYSSINYKKFMNQWKSKIVSQWTSGKMTNFEYLMHLNSFAGRTYNDLTQYPVFPWIIADYESDEIDLNDPASFRDLSKSMGAQGATRAEQFKERYEALASTYFNEDEPPPFHYGTHYSTSAYVLYYLMRLEPFSRLALSLQGGRFDVADRLFHNVGHSWRSASTENLQDVRELIPEFFYLPEFLSNSNGFDFGTTQTGKTVHDVTLPPWAKGDPKRFVRINRQALESEYVSKHLNQWCDLIFGFKQRGEEAVEALNVFVHVTYEGEVDLETMEDPVQRESTIAQIQNFGQTPSRLERKPFPQRQVVSALREKNIDFGALTTLAPLTPPFCVAGAPHLVGIRSTFTDTCKVGMAGQTDSAVGDMCLLKGQIIGVGRTCALILPQKKYYRFGGPNNGVSIHVASTTTRHREVDKLLSIHDGMHRAPISCASVSRNGMWLVTGCMDSTVRVWRHESDDLELRATLCGHEGGQVTCIHVSTVFGIIATGCARGNILLWDLRTLTFIKRLRHPFTESSKSVPGDDSRYPAVSVSINHKNGNIVTLLGSHLSVFDVNGNLWATQGPGEDFGTEQDRPSCAVATDCPEWMDNGIVAVTGHMKGDIRLWSLDYDRNKLIMRHLMPENPHSCPITALRVDEERQDTLLVGDKSGRMSVCKTIALENMNPKQLTKVVDVLRSGVRRKD